MVDDVYEVISPWAEADPFLSGILTPKVDSLEGRKIGLYRKASVPPSRL